MHENMQPGSKQLASKQMVRHIWYDAEYKWYNPALKCLKIQWGASKAHLLSNPSLSAEPLAKPKEKPVLMAYRRSTKPNSFGTSEAFRSPLDKNCLRKDWPLEICGVSSIIAFAAVSQWTLKPYIGFILSHTHLQICQPSIRNSKMKPIISKKICSIQDKKSKLPCINPKWTNIIAISEKIGNLSEELCHSVGPVASLTVA